MNLRQSYKARDKSFFVFGRVFRVAPHERAGILKRQEDGKFVTLDCFRRETICKPRICIVVEKHKDFCLVITVNSYSDRSLDKPSTDAAEHAVARTDRDFSPPTKKDFRRARWMLQEPIMITPDPPEIHGDRQNSLRPRSVLDFGKIFTVQHYYEVEAFGFVSEESLRTLQRHYDTVRHRSAAPNHASIIPLQMEGLSLADSSPFSSQASTAATALTTTAAKSPIKSLSLTKDREYERTFKSLLAEPPLSVYKFISNSRGAEEECDESYRRQAREVYAWGTIFRLLSWEEEPIDEASDITETVAKVADDGAPVLRKILWLLVVQEGEDSCKCLRITTYQGRGVSILPPGLSREDHSIIYTGHDVPPLLDGEVPDSPFERPMGMPIRVRQFNRMEKLFPEARLLWTRVFDVKLDIKAKVFGRVSRSYEHDLEHQFARLNPMSDILVKRPAERNSMAGSSKEGPRLSSAAEASAQQDRLRAQNEFSTLTESDDGYVSSSASSRPVNDTAERQDPERIFGPGEAVLLMTGKDGPSATRKLKIFHIDTARLRRNDERELMWEYSLLFEHGGRFNGGRYFDEAFLMPA